MDPLVPGGSAPSQRRAWDTVFFVTTSTTAAVASLFHKLDHILVQLPLSFLSLVLWVLDFGNTSTPKPAAMAVDTTAKPIDPQGDFEGDIKVDNKPPSKADLEKVADSPVLDVDKKSHTFKSLYADNEQGARRVLIIFIRHFFCGNCQEYLRTPSPPSVPPPSSPPPHPTHQSNNNRLWPTRTHTHVHPRDLLPLPHLRRPHAPTLPPTRHDYDACAR
ncbi:hypothetical protein ABVK25_011997 [Lepraria finkii]|uniref:Uncharacterized protein n=1 Tax=Lepraria finkii TaxID=1340010 RepID=A0ABR4AJ94_9LECA